MLKSEKLVNVVLAVLVVVLLAMCVASIRGQQQASERSRKTDYAGTTR